jgi:hypothetical protein
MRMIKIFIREIITLISIGNVLKPIYIIPLQLRRSFESFHKPIRIDIIKVNLPSPKEARGIEGPNCAAINKIKISHPNAFSNTALPKQIDASSV